LGRWFLLGVKKLFLPLLHDFLDFLDVSTPGLSKT
jgi:hypothetical protein